MGSHRRGGNTASSVELFSEEVDELAASAGLTVCWDTVMLSDLRIEPCLGGRICFEEKAAPARAMGGVLARVFAAQDASSTAR